MVPSAGGAPRKRPSKIPPPPPEDPSTLLNCDRIARESTPASWHPSCGDDGVEQRSSSQWRWRTFGSAFDQLNPYLPKDFAFAHQVYLLSPSTGIEATITDHQVCIDQLQDVQHGIECWTRVLVTPFPVCQRDVREIWQWCGCRPPAEFFRAEYDRYLFLTDLVSTSSSLRAVGVNLTRCVNVLDHCEIERAAVTVAGNAIQTLSVSAPDLYDVRRCLRRLRLDRLENVGFGRYLTRLLAPTLPPADTPPTVDQPRA